MDTETAPDNLDKPDFSVEDTLNALLSEEPTNNGDEIENGNDAAELTDGERVVLYNHPDLV